MEIERKWLVSRNDIPYDLSQLDSSLIEQAYLSFYPTIRIRKINGDRFILTVKTHPENLDHSGLQREEIEIPLTKKEYESLRERVIGNSIEKTRYFHKTEEGLTEEIDVFHKDLDGLALMEIEFEDVDSALRYPDPIWVAKDVTYDYRYKNSSLAQNGIPSDGELSIDGAVIIS